MIIACPQCSSPFELRDNEVAELVQLDCPHCRFRMILDFAAANDPRLVEAGMRMASGYRNAADYRRALTPAARPILVPVEEPEVREPALPAAADTGGPRPSEPAPREVARAEQPAAEARPAETKVVETPRPAEPRRVADVPRPAAPRPVAAEAGDAPGRRQDVDFDGDLPTRVAQRQSTQIGMVPPGIPMPVADAGSRGSGERRAESPGAPMKPGVAPAAEATAAERRSAAATTRPLPEPETQAPPRPVRRVSEPIAAAPTAIDDGLEPTPRRGGAVGAFFLVMLLVLVAGLTVASLLRKNTVDPRPLLEDLYRQYIHR